MLWLHPKSSHSSLGMQPFTSLAAALYTALFGALDMPVEGALRCQRSWSERVELGYGWQARAVLQSSELERSSDSKTAAEAVVTPAEWTAAEQQTLQALHAQNCVGTANLASFAPLFGQFKGQKRRYSPATSLLFC